MSKGEWVMFDTHAHLADSRFDIDRTKVIDNAIQEGILGVVCICSDFEKLDVFYQLLDEYDFIYGAVGIHPNKIVALGEIGLDYYYENSPRDIQKEVFQNQLALAKQRNLPVIIHSREAMKDTLDILQNEEIHHGVIHCFSGTEDDMRICLDMGLYISLAGPVTFPKASNLQNIARLVPPGKLLVETDSPYLAPQSVRGKRNEPSFLKYIIQKVSSLRGVSPKEIGQITFQNARKLFCLF